MTWTTPKDWSVGEALTADLMNTEVRDNLNFLKILGNSVTILQDEKTTDGGTFTAGVWATRDLNTIYGNAENLVALTNNQFTLQAGSYLIYASAPGFWVSNHQCRLQNITGAQTAQYGTCERAHTTGETTNTSQLFAIVSPSSATTYELQHRCTTGGVTHGFGVGTGFGTNIYSQVVIMRIG